MLRQGDVLLVPIDEVPDQLQQVPLEGGRIILAHGEATGHAHVIEGEAALLAEDLEDLERRFLRVEEESELVHDEHDPITVPAGDYEVRRQREYSPEEIRMVAD